MQFIIQQWPIDSRIMPQPTRRSNTIFSIIPQVINEHENFDLFPLETEVETIPPTESSFFHIRGLRDGICTINEYHLVTISLQPNP
eukprot:c13765_g1_i1 orf=120-377(-)